ncbi:MAG: site-2 protease family protein [Nocardioidaceae bacterium]
MTAVVYALGVLLFFFGVLASIALHEVGHMLPAKRFGIKVTQYFVGFGKTVWSRTRGDTEYGLKMFPLGGFIRMVGMLPPAKRNPDGSIRGISKGFFGKLIADARALEYENVTAADEHRLFYRKPWWQKLIVMSGGPLTNVVLALLLFSAVFVGIGIRSPTLVVNDISDCVVPASEPARACRVAPASNPDPIAPAREAGFRPGDEIVSLNGEPMSDWTEFSQAIRANAGEQIDVAIERGGQQLTLSTETLVAQRPSLEDPEAFVNVGFLGVVPEETRQRQSFGYVASTLWDYTARTGEAMVHLPERMAGVTKSALLIEERAQDSPISIVGASRIAGEVARDDSIPVTDRWVLLLSLLGGVNLFVALFNFIPLLPLDGGHIAGALFEAVRRGIAKLRRRPDPGYVDIAQLLPIAYTMAAVLIVMGVLLIWADIVNPIRLAG